MNWPSGDLYDTVTERFDKQLRQSGQSAAFMHLYADNFCLFINTEIDKLNSSCRWTFG